jgi:hypothetical protein
MKTIKTIFLILFSISLLCISCTNKETAEPPKAISNPTSKAIKSALLNGFYSQINDDISLLIYQDNIYYFNTNKKGFDNHKFMLHLINKDNSFINIDFFKNDHEIQDSLKGLFKDVAIIKRNVQIDNFKQIRTGQFKINDNKDNENLWVFQTDISKIHNRNEVYKNQLIKVINQNLIHEDFVASLETGVFFEINNGFYILLSDDQLYIIASEIVQLNDKLMLHFVKSDNTFDNHSFFFNSKEYQDFLEEPYNKIRIAKLQIPQNEDYKRVRVGQFNAIGNIWAQEIVLDDVYSNNLLKYSNELEQK